MKMKRSIVVLLSLFLLTVSSIELHANKNPFKKLKFWDRQPPTHLRITNDSGKTVEVFVGPDCLQLPPTPSENFRRDYDCVIKRVAVLQLNDVITISLDNVHGYQYSYGRYHRVWARILLSITEGAGNRTISRGTYIYELAAGVPEKIQVVRITKDLKMK